MEKGIEQASSKSTTTTSQFMTLQKALELGEYEPEVLSKFDEWKLLSEHGQWQMIKQGLDNREKQLRVQQAEVFNTVDFSKKPQLMDAIWKIQEKIKKIWDDRERIYLEYSNK